MKIKREKEKSCARCLGRGSRLALNVYAPPMASCNPPRSALSAPVRTRNGAEAAGGWGVLPCEPNPMIFSHTPLEDFKVSSVVPGTDRLVCKRPVAGEPTPLPICEQERQRPALGRGRAIVRELGAVRLKDVFKDAVVLF